MNTYDLEKIARDLVKKYGDALEACKHTGAIIDKHDLTGDQIYTLSDMIFDVASGVPL